MTEICFLTIQMGFLRGLAPWLVDGHLLAVTSRGLPPVRVCAQSSSSEKDADHSALGSSNPLKRPSALF